MAIHKVLICGDRNWREEYPPVVKRVIRELVEKHGTKNLVVIEGGAPGVDTLSKIAAHKANVHVAEVEALWKIRKGGAGSQRNEIMKLLEPDEVIGIHVNFKESVGTADMLKRAKAAGIPTRKVRA